jgi:hypothetical protein
MLAPAKSSTLVALILSLAAAAPARADQPPPAAPAATTATSADAVPKHESASVAVPQASPQVSPVPAPTPEEIRRRRVNVTIDSSRPNAVVERRVSVKEQLGAFIVVPFRATDSTWEQVCVTPCTVDLDRFSTYRIDAQNGTAGSSSFTLPQRSDALRLNVDARSLVVHRAGRTMSVAGIAAVIVGGSLLVAASSFRHPSDARVAGAATGGAGIALAAVGIPLSLATMSRVTTDDGREVSKVYGNHGYALPFLPDIKLSRGMTLTQRGIIF